jgi:hypothetical protein
VLIGARPALCPPFPLMARLGQAVRAAQPVALNWTEGARPDLSRAHSRATRAPPNPATPS